MRRRLSGGLVQIVLSRVAGGVIKPDEVLASANRADDVTLHNLREPNTTTRRTERSRSRWGLLNWRENRSKRSQKAEQGDWKCRATRCGAGLVC